MERVYLHVWTGDARQAQEAVSSLYPGCDVQLVSHRELRANGVREQVRTLRSFHGRAFIYFFAAKQDNKQGRLLAATHLFHSCRDTVVLYGDAGHERLSANGISVLLRTAGFAIADGFVLGISRIVLPLINRKRHHVALGENRNGTQKRVAYLFPFPLHRFTAGGAVTHVRGVVRGFVQNGTRVDLYTGADLPVDELPARRIRMPNMSLTSEAATVLYNLIFVRVVHREITSGPRPTMLYQRHGRFVIAGALLSRWLNIPLVLEYNGSEVWMSEHWDPTRFRRHLQLCEEIALRAAAKIIVVSQASVDELVERGIARDRIVLNPNAVDPEVFRPDCGGAALRQRLGFRSNDVVCGFAGSFSYWHGIRVLEKTIQRLLSAQDNTNIRFLLVGDGPLRAEMASQLASWINSGLVVLTGTVPHDRVNMHLDAADILLSPHVPMPDGTPFFGSPTKLFEYMAAGKCIIASSLDQIGQVLTHMETAILVQPANDAELEAAIVCAAADPELRRRLGKNARSVAIARHTWLRNAQCVLELAASKTSQQHVARSD